MVEEKKCLNMDGLDFLYNFAKRSTEDETEGNTLLYVMDIAGLASAFGYLDNCLRQMTIMSGILYIPSDQITKADRMIIQGQVSPKVIILDCRELVRNNDVLVQCMRILKSDLYQRYNTTTGKYIRPDLICLGPVADNRPDWSCIGNSEACRAFVLELSAQAILWNNRSRGFNEPITDTVMSLERYMTKMNKGYIVDGGCSDVPGSIVLAHRTKTITGETFRPRCHISDRRSVHRYDDKDDTYMKKRGELTDVRTYRKNKELKVMSSNRKRSRMVLDVVSESPMKSDLSQQVPPRTVSYTPNQGISVFIS